jgi:hypothetical protein
MLFSFKTGKHTQIPIFHMRKRKSVDGQQKVISSINSKKKETASKLHET